MNKISFFLLFALFGSIFFTSCLEDKCVDNMEYYQYNSVTMTLAEIRSDIVVDIMERQIQNPGKMYYYKDHLFINEKGKGVHVYNNINVANPSYVAYYSIPGNFDIVIKDDILIADNAMDMITLDISDLTSPQFLNRIENFKEVYMSDNEDQQYYIYSERLKARQIIDCADSNFGNNQFWRGGVWLTDFDAGGVILNETGGSGSTGVGGSTARFTTVNDYLYTVDHSNLISFDISNPSNPTKEAKNSIGWGIETIFPYEDKLFIGSNAGMYIYGLSNPASPVRLTSFQHARACDPVVAQGNWAYVTLRDGSQCEGFTNQLEIIDVTNVLDPGDVYIHKMDNPHGLAINGDILYLSEGEYGLKVLDVSKKDKVKEVHYDRTIKSIDVIYLGNDHLLSIGADGFYQFDVSDPQNIVELSHIPVIE